jgi:predicted N-formylglutamate amidohydrolase
MLPDKQSLPRFIETTGICRNNKLKKRKERSTQKAFYEPFLSYAFMRTIDQTAAQQLFLLIVPICHFRYLELLKQITSG